MKKAVIGKWYKTEKHIFKVITKKNEQYIVLKDNGNKEALEATNLDFMIEIDQALPLSIIDILKYRIIHRKSLPK